MIHPTAIIDPKAKIGENCQIGPYCTIGPNVTLGDGCILDSHVVITGNTIIGKNNHFYPFCCIGTLTQDLKYNGGDVGVCIGDNNTFREYVTIHEATIDGARTILGNNINLLAYCHIAHDCVIGDNVIMSNLAQMAGHVTVEDNVVVGGMSAAHQFVRIGRMSMIGACSKIGQDILPYSLSDGSPCVPVSVNKIGMERRGVPAENVKKIIQAHKLVFRSKLLIKEALEEVRKIADVPEVQHICEFIETSQRGLARK